MQIEMRFLVDEIIVIEVSINSEPAAKVVNGIRLENANGQTCPRNRSQFCILCIVY